MNRIFTLIITLTLFFGCQTVSAAPNSSTSTTVPEAIVPLNHLPALKGDYFKIDSAAVGHAFHIYVRYPEEYDSKQHVRYPVVYLTDGDSLFPLVATNHLFLHYDDKLPEAIVVGIAYGSFHPTINKRGYDYSAPTADAKPSQGGAKKYSEFLRTELIPQIDKKYRTNPERRILFGQSRGGHYVLYSAFTEPDLFWGRIVSNPPLEPWKDHFFSQPTQSLRSGLGLVYASGSRDRPDLRADALEWFKAWEKRHDAPWKIKTMTIEGGTHAADALNVYRKAMQWLFFRNSK